MNRVINMLDGPGMDNRIRGPRPHIVRERIIPFAKYDGVDILKKYRFRRVDIDFIVGEIEQDLEHMTDQNGAPSPQMQVLSALRFYATGAYYNLVGEGFNISP